MVKVFDIRNVGAYRWEQLCPAGPVRSVHHAPAFQKTQCAPRSERIAT